MTKAPNGFIIYRGPSMLDGQPIVCIATGFAKGSTNTKTGAMIQTWIMRDDIKPVDAIHSGEDKSICGDCPHRGVIVNGRNVKRPCYVAVWQAPRNVYETYKRGNYGTTVNSNLAALGRFEALPSLYRQCFFRLQFQDLALTV